MRIDGSTRLAGVFGAPVKHTASPAMHNAAFEALEMNWAYLAFHVVPDDLQAALCGARDLGLAGVNLTVPHKLLALEMMDEIDSEAEALGAVNTVCFQDGKMSGTNTDGYGIVTAVCEEFGLALAGCRVLILGAGGAGRALAVKCALERAARVVVANRTMSKTESIARDLAKTDTEFEAVPLESAALAEAIAEADLVMNATSVGLDADDRLPVETRFFRTDQCVLDTIYQPSTTAFLATAGAAGARVANGLSMLLHQGVRAFEIWTGRAAPVDVMRAALRAAVYGAAA
jgi:shikimate dehydrogenase